ncbi:hypothetical protein FRC02_001920 [Tulasnella sp. 418]|nr:hypothetical protein FRC02_001920 [Tulasnella sp. 418]
MALLLEKDFTEGIGESISWLSSILPPISSNSVDYSDVWNRFANPDPKHPLELVGRDSVGSSGFQPFNSIDLNQTFEASGSGPSSRVLGSSLPSAISQDHHVSFDQKRFRDGSSELDSPNWSNGEGWMM